MKKLFAWVIVIAAIIIALFVIDLTTCNSNWCFVTNWQKVKHTNDFATCADRGFPILQTYPRVCKAGDKTFTEEVGPQPFVSDNVVVTQPLSNAKVMSPMYIKGEAKGTWYFEASFPISVVDANGTALGGSIATAKSDWMTTSFVPFEATITYKTPTTPTGWIIFSKDNPSGMPENDGQEKMPIKF